MAAALVTGANRGIGLEFCRQLSKRGDSVIAVCRKSSPELDALSIRVESSVDVADAKSIAALAEKLKGVSLDLLINNAGILHHESLGSLDFQSIEQQLRVNAFGPLRVTEALLPNLKKGSKVALITSRMGSIADNTSGGSYGYRMSKAALNAAGMSLAIDLKPREISVIILHPGYVRTGMTMNHGNVDPSESAKQLLERIDQLTIESTGRFLHANGEVLPW